MNPLTTSDLIFSEQANLKFSETLGDIKRSTLSIQNRLRSIQEDALFAQTVAEAYGRPLIANERCGSWYIEPVNKGGSAYFKSTDGHTGVWKFSSRRLNLHLLDIIGKHDGCIIVDSTRRGKRMPDALSKTIPIWCSVLNSILFPADTKSHELHSPPQVVSQSEHSQISALLPSFQIALKALRIPFEELRRSISKPLRPIWVTPDSHITETGNVFSDFHPVICCTVSRRVIGGEHSAGGYIQGAGDDTENWAYGLTPPIFWEARETLMSTPGNDLPSLIERLVQDKATLGDSGAGIRCVKPTSSLFISPIAASMPPTETGVCNVFLMPKISDESTWQTSSRQLDVGLGPHKIGSRNLRAALPTVVEFAGKSLYQEDTTEEKHILIACESGKDFSIGVGLTLVCLFFDDHGKLLAKDSKRPMINKEFVRSRLGWFSTSMPDANPSRSTLQSVNSYLMDRPTYTG